MKEKKSMSAMYSVSPCPPAWEGKDSNTNSDEHKERISELKSIIQLQKEKIEHLELKICELKKEVNYDMSATMNEIC